MKINKKLGLFFVCFILGFMVSVQFRSVNENSRTISLENKTRNELKEILLDEKRKNEKLTKRYEQIKEELAVFESSYNNMDMRVNSVKEEVKILEIFSGYTTIKGKGVVITLGNKSDSLVSEVQLLAIINELKIAEVQAISINDERILAMTEVKEDGYNLIINGKSIKSPLIVKAIIYPEKVNNLVKNITEAINKSERLNSINVNITTSNLIIIPKTDRLYLSNGYNLLNQLTNEDQ